MAEPIPEVHAISAALLDIEGAGQLARAMDVGLLTERQARTAGEPRLAPDGRAQPLMFGTVECWDAIVRGDRRGFGKRGGGRRRGRSWGSAERRVSPPRRERRRRSRPPRRRRRALGGRLSRRTARVLCRRRGASRRHCRLRFNSLLHGRATRRDPAADRDVRSGRPAPPSVAVQPTRGHTHGAAPVHP